MTWSNFILGNLFLVTIGNIIGSAVGVGAVYYIIYLRRRSSAAEPKQVSSSEDGYLGKN